MKRMKTTLRQHCSQMALAGFGDQRSWTKYINWQLTNVTDLNTIRQVYFLGIGGIGMSALARYFKATGKKVAGYDRTSTELTLS